MNAPDRQEIERRKAEMLERREVYRVAHLTATRSARLEDSKAALDAALHCINAIDAYMAYVMRESTDFTG